MGPGSFLRSFQHLVATKVLTHIFVPSINTYDLFNVQIILDVSIKLFLKEISSIQNFIFKNVFRDEFLIDFIGVENFCE